MLEDYLARYTAMMHISEILSDPKYNWQLLPRRHVHADEEWAGTLGENNIYIGDFREFYAVEIGFGKIRSMWPNKKVIAEHGTVYASSSYRHHDNKPVSGSGIPGYNILGLKWRTGTGIGRYVQVPDIVEYLLAQPHEMEEWEKIVWSRGDGDPGWGRYSKGEVDYDRVEINATKLTPILIELAENFCSLDRTQLLIDPGPEFLEEGRFPWDASVMIDGDDLVFTGSSGPSGHKPMMTLRVLQSHAQEMKLIIETFDGPAIPQILQGAV